MFEILRLRSASLHYAQDDKSEVSALQTHQLVNRSEFGIR